MSDHKHCAFLAHRNCYVEVEEIPLEVCQLCVEAWWVDKEVNILSQRQLGVPATDIAPRQEPRPEETHTRARRKLQDELKELDRLFTDDAIEPQEYVARRNALINAMTGVSRPAIHVQSIEEEKMKTGNLNILVIEKPAFGSARLVGGSAGLLPTVNSKTLDAIYNLAHAITEDNRMQLTVDGNRISVLGSNKNQVALLLLTGEDTFEDHAEEIRQISSMLQESSDWEFATQEEKQKNPAKTLSNPLP